MVRCLLFLLLLGPPLAAQPPLVLSGKLPAARMDIGPYTGFYKDVSGDTLPLAMVKRMPFRPFTEKANERDEFANRSLIVTWLRFTLRNSHPTDTLRILHNTAVHGLITLYEGDSIIGRTGIGLPPERRPNRFALSLSVPPRAERTFHVRVLDYIWSPMPVFSEVLSIWDNYVMDYQWHQQNDRVLLVALSLLTGFLLLMASYAAFAFFLTRDRAFLYYAFYAGACVAFCLHHLNLRFEFNLLFPLRISDALSPVHVPLIAFFYALFLSEILGVRQHFPRIWQLLRVLLLLLMGQQLHATMEWVAARPFFANNAIYVYSVVPTVLTSCVLMGVILDSRSRLRFFLLTGLLSMLLIGVIPNSLEIYLQPLSPMADTFVNYPYFWITLGLTLESFCFMMALAYRGQLTELENLQIQERYAHDLETQLAERAQEIERQVRQLEAQHVRQIEQGFEQKLAETEMTALRSQMNPHFIFNCLNSIKLYTLENDSATASEFLTKFSRLIRLVLENSRLERVVLADELDALRLYIELEAMRYKDKLRYEIRVQPGLDPQYFDVPPMLLQPFVENAIWHGLMHKTEGGTVSLNLDQPDETHVRVTITDDGIGRRAAAALKSKSATRHKSFGMQVTSERIRLINQFYRSQTRVEIHDLVDPEGQPAGTEVEIWIPV